MAVPLHGVNMSAADLPIRAAEERDVAQQGERLERLDAIRAIVGPSLFFGIGLGFPSMMRLFPDEPGKMALWTLALASSPLLVGAALLGAERVYRAVTGLLSPTVVQPN